MVWRSIRLALDNQLSELTSNQAKQQSRIPLELSGALYGTVQGRISYEALWKVEEQRKLLMRDLSTICTGTFSRVYGLPCLHTLDTLQGEPLLLDHFHSHWHLRCNGTMQLLLEPRQHIESTSSSIPKSSTKREPSHFEVVEAQAARPHRAASQCTNCGTIGHTRASRACPLRYSDIL